MSNKTDSQPATQTVVSTAPQSSEVTVYTGGPAIVREQRSVDLAEGKSLVTLEGLPEQYVPGSLTIAKVAGPDKFKLGAFSYRPANLSTEAILEKALGKQVTLHTSDGDVTGVLRCVLGNQIVLQQEAGARIVQNDGSITVAPSCLDSLSASASVRLEGSAAKAGAYNLGIMYAAEGLTWAQRFEAFYDAKEEKLLRFACLVDLTNNTGAALGSTRFQLIAGYNNGYQQSYQHGRRGGVRMAMAAAAPMGGALESASFSADSAESETVGEQKLYTLPAELAIAVGETKTTTLVMAENVPVVAEYMLSAGWYQPAAQLSRQDQKLPVNVRLSLKNDAASNLGVALPPGQVNVFEPDSKGSLQRTDSTQVQRDVAVGESFQLTLNTPSKDVKAQRKLVSQKDDPEPKAEEPPVSAPVKPLGGPNVGTPEGRPQPSLAAAMPAPEQPKKPRYRTETRELTVFNYKDKEVDVTVQDQVPAEVEFTKPIGGVAVKNLAETRGLVTYVVTVPAGGSTKVKYTIKHRIA